jgi:hypothetical protein
MTEQHILNELYKAQGDLEKAKSIVNSYQDVIRAAQRLVDIIGLPPRNSSTTTAGGNFSDAYGNLQQALKTVFDPNGDAQ